MVWAQALGACPNPPECVAKCGNPVASPAPGRLPENGSTVRVCVLWDPNPRPFAMRKAEGSNPFIRSKKTPLRAGSSCPKHNDFG